MSSSICDLPQSEREAILLRGLDFLSPLDLARNPPNDDTTLQEMLLGPQVIDRTIRVGINRKFRRPCSKPDMPPGFLKPSTTYGDLKKLI